VSLAILSSRAERARDSARRAAAVAARWALFALGCVVIVAGLATALLPGHIGVPLLVVGLMIVLRQSIGAKRRFLKLQKAHPKIVFPIRRLMRRNPQIVLVIWQQYLRVERFILPSRYRFAKRVRGHLKRRFFAR
jgi:hypothetical protein